MMESICAVRFIASSQSARVSIWIGRVRQTYPSVRAPPLLLTNPRQAHRYRHNTLSLDFGTFGTRHSVPTPPSQLLLY